MHPCARCATMQKTCCQQAEILITAGDAARIRAHAARDDFSEFRAPDDPGYLEHDPDDPNWTRWTVRADGARRVLKRQHNGDCTFLGSQGCTLPAETRPLVCRLYPFDYTERGLNQGESAHYCPTAVLAPERVSRGEREVMLTVLNMGRPEGERWRAQLYRELREEHESRRSIPDAERIVAPPASAPAPAPAPGVPR